MLECVSQFLNILVRKVMMLAVDHMSHFWGINNLFSNLSLSAGLSGQYTIVSTRLIFLFGARHSISHQEEFVK